MGVWACNNVCVCVCVVVGCVERLLVSCGQIELS